MYTEKLFKPQKKKETMKETAEVYASQNLMFQSSNRRSDGMAFNKLKKETEIVISQIFRDVFEGEKVWDTYLDFQQFKELLNKLNFIN